MSYQLTLKQGNLLDEQNATFIVNASNTQLLLGSGVSMAFKRHCGLELQHEMTTKLEEIGQTLSKGDVVATSSAGATNFTYALHAAIMDYNQGTKGLDKYPSLEEIELTLKSIEPYLKWYAEDHTEPMSLVLPLMGTGVGGLNVLDVYKVYQAFFSKSAPFNCSVVIYAYNQQDYEWLSLQ